jgi:hypothetical protein
MLDVIVLLLQTALPQGLIASVKGVFLKGTDIQVIGVTLSALHQDITETHQEAGLLQGTGGAGVEA